MFRRRGPVRPIVRPIVRRAVRPVVVPVVAPAAGVSQVPPALRRANELMNAGRYAEAADIFDQFAKGAEMRGGARAPQFFLQAGRCRMLAGQMPAGMIPLMHGLALLAQRGDFQHLANAGRRTAEELRQHGFSAEAAKVEELVQHNLPAGFIPAAGAAPASSAEPAKPRLLPPHCPSCGGNLVSGEAVWLDEATAECPYCGSGVRAE